jgi:hypothetical protein
MFKKYKGNPKHNKDEGGGSHKSNTSDKTNPSLKGERLGKSTGLDKNSGPSLLKSHLDLARESIIKE